MNNFVKFLGGATLAMGVLCGVAPATKAQAPADCAALYQKWYENRKTNQPAAFEAGRTFGEQCQSDATYGVDPYFASVKKFVTEYDRATKREKLENAIASKKYDEAFATGRELLNTTPDDLLTLMQLAYFAGFQGSHAITPAVSSDDPFAGQTVDYAKKALSLINNGATLKDWGAFKSKSNAVGYLNYAIAEMMLDANPNEAATYYYAAVQTDAFRREAAAYSQLGYAYQKGMLIPMTDDFKAKYNGKPESPESKLAYLNLQNATDVVIDAYAHAISLATDPKLGSAKADWRTQVTELTKFRNGDPKKIDTIISGAATKPLATPFTPLTELPAVPETPSAPTTPAAPSTVSTLPTATKSPATAVTPATAKPAAKKPVAKTPAPKKKG